MSVSDYRREIYILAVLVGVFISLKYLLPYFTPFIIGAILAIVIDPAVDWLEKRLRIPRGWGALLILSLVVVILVTFLITGIGRLVYELDLLLQTLPKYQESITNVVNRLLDQLSQLYAGLPGVFNRAIASGEQSLYKGISSMIKQLLGFFQRLPNYFIVGLISFIASFFMSRDKRIISRAILRFLPERWRKHVFEVKEDVFTSFSGFLRAQLILVSMTMIMSIIGLTILRVKYAWLLAMVTGFFDLIPVFGPSGVFVPIAIYFFFLDQIPTAIGVIINLAIILLVRQISEPRIIGSKVGIHPLATLLAIYLGFRLFGVSGFILGPLGLIIIKAIFAATLPEAS